MKITKELRDRLSYLIKMVFCMSGDVFLEGKPTVLSGRNILKEFERATGISSETQRPWFDKETAGISADKIQFIIDKLKVNPNWIYSGEGAIFKPDSPILMEMADILFPNVKNYKDELIAILPEMDNDDFVKIMFLHLQKIKGLSRESILLKNAVRDYPGPTQGKPGLGRARSDT
jgi:hypothetical protein